MQRPDINTLFKSNKTAHLIGIGGVSMCSLAENLISMGISVTGSDSNTESDAVKRLTQKGVRVFKGHFSENVTDAGYIIRTAAVHDDNPEIVAAADKGIPVYERAEAYGAIMAACKQAVCFAGTHGKTSSTAMFTYIALSADADPSVMIGGVLPVIGGGNRIGGGDMYILEACEYRNSFLNFKPTVPVILNIEEDHMDFFRDLDDISNSFKKFALLSPEDSGVVVANADDPNTVECVKNIDRKKLFFGFSEGADVRAQNLTFDKGLPRFDIVCPEGVIERVALLVPGRHNCMNALAAAAAAIACGLPLDAVKRGLGAYSGVARRFEYKGHYGSALIYDDYAHHPGELKVLFDSALNMGYNRVIAVFQPHTYTRTKAFFDGFVEQLSRPDKLLLADIYAARETDTLGVSSQLLADKIENAECIHDYDDIVIRLKQIINPGDLVLTIGAGEMDKVAERLAETEELK